MGILSDKFNNRHILLVSQIGSMVSYGLLGFTNNMKILFLTRVIVGLTK